MTDWRSLDDEALRDLLADRGVLPPALDVVLARRDDDTTAARLDRFLIADEQENPR